MPSRRTLLVTLAALCTGLGPRLVRAEATLDADTAYQRTKAGELLLIDIRQPEEWTATGSPDGAHRLDMGRPDFFDALSDLAGNDRSCPIALICASGGRSARMANALTDHGYSQVLDVSEGMLGSSSGPGWLARGLPVITN